MNKTVEVILSPQYVKNRRKLVAKHDKRALDRLTTAVRLLSSLQQLPNSYKPHKLKGVNDTWECHITGDTLLTWRYVNNQLVVELHLLNITNHDSLSRKSQITGEYSLIHMYL